MAEKKVKESREERYHDYLRLKANNDITKAEEQSKMDNVILNCGIGLIGVALLLLVWFLKKIYVVGNGSFHQYF